MNGISFSLYESLLGNFTGEFEEQSPAQKMADTWDMRIRAFEMRSNYV